MRRPIYWSIIILQGHKLGFINKLSSAIYMLENVDKIENRLVGKHALNWPKPSSTQLELAEEQECHKQ